MPELIFNLLSTPTIAAGCSPFDFCTVKILQAKTNWTKIRLCCKTWLILSASSEPFWIEYDWEGSLMPWGIFATRRTKERITQGSLGMEQPHDNLNMQECHQATLLPALFNFFLFFFPLLLLSVKCLSEVLCMVRMKCIQPHLPQNQRKD